MIATNIMAIKKIYLGKNEQIKKKIEKNNRLNINHN